MNYLFILNDLAHGTERSYNGLRLAGSLARDTAHEVKVFLIREEGITCAHKNQKFPQEHYNVEVMLKAVIKYGGEAGVWASCMDARGMEAGELVEGTHRSSLEQLTAGTSDAHRVLVF